MSGGQRSPRRPRRNAAIPTKQATANRLCPVCALPMPEERLYGHIQADLDLLSDLMRRNPSWVQPDGSCPRAIEVLRARAADPQSPQAA